MDPPLKEVDFIRNLRAGRQAAGDVFWLNDTELAVLDPEAAQEVNAANFADQTMPDRLVDLLRRRKSEPVSWKEVRAAWHHQLHRLSDLQGIRQLADRMQALLDERLDCPLDLVWAAQEVCSQALLPSVLAGLSPSDTERVLRDQRFKLSQLLSPVPEPKSFWRVARSFMIQAGAGLVIRRELKGRATGRKPRRLDLTDPMVDLLPVLGIDRAVNVVTTVLTGIAGPPGAVAACLVYELTRRPDWAIRLESELAPIPLERLYEAATRVAPVTYRFVKETLRMWSSPLVLTRPVVTPIRFGQKSLDLGHLFHVSSYFIHHDPRHWPDPDTFDPDRWLTETHKGHPAANTYVPFGWAPTSCIGAGLGIAQLMLLCHLLSTRYRIHLSAPEAVRIVLALVPLPLNFRGTITRR